MDAIDRRRFMTVAGAGALLGVVTPGLARASDRALALGARRAVSTAGTTLEQVAEPAGNGGYSRLGAGPGWPLVVRSDLAAGKSGRDDRRSGRAAFVQFTDVHLVDAQSPMRFEYLHPFVGAGAFRPQETLTTQGFAALVEQVNGLAGGPFTGLPLAFMMSTGDNTDNHETLELGWFLRGLTGGTLTPNSGAEAFEGVQNSDSTEYWNPESAIADDYRQVGFPTIPGFLSRATAPFSAPRLELPWYVAIGNHDDSVVGTVPSGIPFFDDAYTGSRKVEGFDQDTLNRLGKFFGDPRFLADLISLLGSQDGLVRTVTPDAGREPFTTAGFVQAFLDPAHTGSGPAGHGFDESNADGVDVYYTFPIAAGITGISLDTTTLGGFADGSIGLGQYEWVERTLRAGSSHYVDVFGNEQQHSVDDELFVVFSHHTSGTMDNLIPDSRHPFEPRLDGNAFVDLLQRFPNVVAWVNGHTHRNEITPHHHDDPRRAFWEINTASHVDYPQQARIVEVADNRDGTLSLFTTLVESAAPYQAPYDSSDRLGLASLYREFAFNDIHYKASRNGGADDHNTELLLRAPFGK
jgi:metallophosphoesterase (TIGR03767 family)